jgi:hypothetical protein
MVAVAVAMALSAPTRTDAAKHWNGTSQDLSARLVRGLLIHGTGEVALQREVQ